MDIKAHGDSRETIIKRVRDWLNTNRSKGTLPLPGAAAINADFRAYLKIVPDIIQNLRLDVHDQLPPESRLFPAGRGHMRSQRRVPPARARARRARSRAN